MAGDTAANVRTGKLRGRAIVKGGAGTAARTVGLLGGIFTYAVRQGIRADNPVIGVDRVRDNQRNRALTPDEYQALAIAIASAEGHGVSPTVIAAIRLVALTGLRKTEAVSLKYGDVDRASGAIRMEDSKTGTTTRPIGAEALSVIPEQGGHDRGGFVFPASRGNGCAKM
jgi:integrase